MADKEKTEGMSDEPEDNIVVLNDDDGNEIRFEFLDIIEYKSQEFVVLLPVEETEGDGDGEVVILKIVETENADCETYTSVDDEALMKEVFDIFKEKFKDEFNFAD